MLTRLVPILLIAGFWVDARVQIRFGHAAAFDIDQRGMIVPSALARSLGWADLAAKVILYAVYVWICTAQRQRHDGWFWLSVSVSALLVLAECCVRGWSVIWGDMPTRMAQATGIGSAGYTLLPLIGVTVGLAVRLGVWFATGSR